MLEWLALNPKKPIGATVTEWMKRQDSGEVSDVKIRTPYHHPLFSAENTVFADLQTALLLDTQKELAIWIHEEYRKMVLYASRTLGFLTDSHIERILTGVFLFELCSLKTMALIGRYGNETARRKVLDLYNTQYTPGQDSQELFPQTAELIREAFGDSNGWDFTGSGGFGPARAWKKGTGMAKNKTHKGTKKRVRVTGTGVVGGKPTSTNLAGSTDDSNGHHVAALDTGGVVEFILAGGNTYLKADEAFWKAQRLEDFGRPYLGKWLKSPAAKKVEGSTTVSHHLKSLIDSSAPELLAPAVETTTLDGKPVFVWTRSLGKEAGQVFVANAAHYPQVCP